VPPGVAARIRTGGSGLSEVKVDEARFPRSEDSYELPDYGTAANRVDLTITAGASSVKVR